MPSAPVLASAVTARYHHRDADVLLWASATRLLNELRNLKAACALHFAHYNFCRVHSSLRITPAIAAGLTGEVWELDRLLA